MRFSFVDSPPRALLVVDEVDDMDDMDPVDQVDRVIPKHGGYRNLKSYQVAQLVYDLTVWFCDRYIDRRSRTQNRWFKQLDPACKTSLREARLQGFPRRLK